MAHIVMAYVVMASSNRKPPFRNCGFQFRFVVKLDLCGIAVPDPTWLGHRKPKLGFACSKLGVSKRKLAVLVLWFCFHDLTCFRFVVLRFSVGITRPFCYDCFAINNPARCIKLSGWPLQWSVRRSGTSVRKGRSPILAAIGWLPVPSVSSCRWCFKFQVKWQLA